MHIIGCSLSVKIQEAGDRRHLVMAFVAPDTGLLLMWPGVSARTHGVQVSDAEGGAQHYTHEAKSQTQVQSAVSVPSGTGV